MDDNSPNQSIVEAPLDGDHMDISALREFSVSEFDKEYPNEKPKSEPEVEETATEEEEAPAEEAEEEEEEGEEEPEAAEEKKFVTAKDKDGKEIKIPKDALIEVKVDGKTEMMTAQDIINKASGAQQVERQLTNLGHERVKLQKERQIFDEEATVTRDNLEILTDIARNQSPQDFVLYYSMLTGQNADTVMQDMIKQAIVEAERFSGMTPRERELYNENRQFKFSQEQRKREEARHAQKQTSNQERAQVDAILTENGLEMADFLAAAHDVKARIESGELKGKYSAKDIAEYAVTYKSETSVSDAISAVDKALLKDKAFVSKVTKARIAGEVSGERFTPKELQALVKRIKEHQTKGISESLSKKVDRHVSSGKTNSQSANSRNQEKSNAGSSVTLADHRDRLYGGY